VNNHKPPLYVWMQLVKCLSSWLFLSSCLCVWYYWAILYPRVYYKSNVTCNDNQAKVKQNAVIKDISYTYWLYYSTWTHYMNLYFMTRSQCLQCLLLHNFPPQCNTYHKLGPLWQIFQAEVRLENTADEHEISRCPILATGRLSNHITGFLQC
jgi:hypothetical protein